MFCGVAMKMKLLCLKTRSVPCMLRTRHVYHQFCQAGHLLQPQRWVYIHGVSVVPKFAWVPAVASSHRHHLSTAAAHNTTHDWIVV